MAEDDDDSQKTEDPSSKRLDEAREQGRLPISRETVQWINLLAIAAIVGWMLPAAATDLIKYFSVILESSYALSVGDSNAQALMKEILLRILLSLGMIYAVLMGGSIIGTWLQSGFFFSAAQIKFDFDRLSPMAGLKRLVSMTALVELAKTLLKLGLMGGVAVLAVWPFVKESSQMIGISLIAIVQKIHHRMVYLLFMLLLAFTVIAAMDFFYTRFAYFKSLRMTKSEVKDEYKQSEGDPAVKGRLRQLRAERARKRMMAQVPRADVIVTNPTHYAIALQYDNAKMTAPVVLAKGVDLIAERIRDLATEHNIPLVSNPPLARALYDTTEIDQEIPIQHYRAVAEVIAYVFKLKKR